MQPTGIKHVHIVYLNKVLQAKDQKDFEELWNMIPKGMGVHYHSDIIFQPKLHSVIIIDESDDLVFTDPAAFMKFTRNRACICLTASPADKAERGIER